MPICFVNQGLIFIFLFGGEVGLENIGVCSALLALAVGMSWKMEAGHLHQSNGMCLSNVAVLIITL